MEGERRRSDAPAPVALRAPKTRGLVEIVADVRLITPLFGGGVHVEGDPLRRQDKQPDRVTPFRGAAVRGQLRFWWRAVHAARYGTLAALREAESSLWGAASSPGACALDISHGPLKVAEVEVFEMRQGNNGRWNPRARPGCEDLAYGAFPLQPKGGETVELTCGRLHRLTGEAHLRLLAPEGREAEVEAALRAWLLFGGLGGRTRRGFGAVEATGAVFDPRAFLRTIPSGDAPAGVPRLHGARLAIAPRTFDKPEDAMKWALRALRELRQGRDLGRNPGQTPNRPGRSRWPEAEAIRKITGRSDAQHRERFVGVDKFPRAAFGMPIIFHFQSGQDPKDTRLQPKGAERLASPLLLRPVRVGRDAYRALALVLAGTTDAIDAVELKDAPPADISARLTADEARRIRPLGGQTDPLAAFLGHFESRS
jgi:CRISPR-associated protein Cmr1